MFPDQYRHLATVQETPVRPTQAGHFFPGLTVQETFPKLKSYP